MFLSNFLFETFIFTVLLLNIGNSVRYCMLFLIELGLVFRKPFCYCNNNNYNNNVNFILCLRKMFLYVLGPVAVWFLYRWYKESKRVPNRGDKYVYITGCDTGFGNLLARHLDQLGFRVIAGCYTEKGEDELKKTTSDRLTTVHVDVSDSESVKQAAASIKDLVGEKGEWISSRNGETLHC